MRSLRRGTRALASTVCRGYHAALPDNRPTPPSAQQAHVWPVSLRASVVASSPAVTWVIRAGGKHGKLSRMEITILLKSQRWRTVCGVRGWHPPGMPLTLVHLVPPAQLMPLVPPMTLMPAPSIPVQESAAAVPEHGRAVRIFSRLGREAPSKFFTRAMIHLRDCSYCFPEVRKFLAPSGALTDQPDEQLPAFTAEVCSPHHRGARR